MAVPRLVVKRVWVWALVLGALPLGGVSCYSTPPVLAPGAYLPIPTKDDVAVVNGRALPLAAFLTLRTQWRALPKDDVLWVAMVALSLQTDAEINQSLKEPLSPDESLLLAEFGAGARPYPEVQHLTDRLNRLSPLQLSPTVSSRDYRGRLDLVLKRAIVQKNPLVLAELN